MARKSTRKLGRPSFVNCRVLWANLWTSKGKFLKGDEVMLPPAEAGALDADDKIKIVGENA